MTHYDLDPFHFVSAASMTWQAALKKTGEKLELITDVDQYNFVKRGIRGGVSYIATKHAKANNKDMDNLYDKDKQSSYISYIDMNNLYGYAMMQPLPIGDFKWVEPKLYVPTKTFNYFYEVDLRYPEKFHDDHNDFPLVPEVLTPLSSKHPKLIPHLGSRKNYVVSCHNLHYYKSKGIVIEKIHKVLKYRQKAWLEEYIKHNTKLRAQAKNEFEKDFFKLMNNAVYGQTLMDVTKFSNFEMVTSQERYKWLQRKYFLIKKVILYSECKKCKELDGSCIECDEEENCFSEVEKIKPKVTLNRPIYVGFQILELSKLHMYRFWYDVLKVKCPNIRLLMTDTDSFIFQIFCEDLDIELQKMSRHFDISNYDKIHFLHSTKNLKTPGYMKNEYPSKIITHYTGLRSKEYAFKFFDEQKEKRAKGITRVNKKKNIHYEDYENTFFNKATKIVTETKIQSKKLKMCVISQDKETLSNNDDKRAWIGHWPSQDIGNTLALGHYKLIEAVA